MTPLERVCARGMRAVEYCDAVDQGEQGLRVKDVLVRAQLAAGPNSRVHIAEDRLRWLRDAEDIAGSNTALSPLRRNLLKADLRGLALMVRCLEHPDPVVREMATTAFGDDAFLFPLRDRLEELGEDAAPLMWLLPPRPAPVVVEDESGIPY